MPIHDTTSGIGDITVTPMVGWHKGKLHYSAALSIFAPIGGHSTSSIDVPGYAYQQLDDDSGAGAASTNAALGATSLSARVYGLGPIITYSGASMFGQDVSFEFKYYKGFSARRRFESDTFWFNVGGSF